jgi:hypothetical protein
MTALIRLGFKKDWVYETIVTTQSADGMNAAPMGVWSTDLVSICLLIHKTAKTYENIRKEKRFAVNFPGDVALFYDAILEDDTLRTENGTLALEGCDAILEAEVSGMEDKGRSSEVTAKIISCRIKKRPQLINRAEYLALDSLIAYTKLSFVPEKEKAMLIERIRENLRVIRSTAPGSEFLKRAERLLD